MATGEILAADRAERGHRYPNNINNKTYSLFRIYFPPSNLPAVYLFLFVSGSCTHLQPRPHLSNQLNGSTDRLQLLQTALFCMSDSPLPGNKRPVKEALVKGSKSAVLA